MENSFIIFIVMALLLWGLISLIVTWVSEAYVDGQWTNDNQPDRTQEHGES